MTNADESPTNRLTLFPIYLSLFVVSTLWLRYLSLFLSRTAVYVTHVKFSFTKKTCEHERMWLRKLPRNLSNYDIYTYIYEKFSKYRLIKLLNGYNVRLRSVL